MTSAWDLAIAGRTVWAEARGEGNDGMIAVAWAIVNRLKVDKWYSGTNLARCCLYPYQFSSWNVGDPNGPQALRLTETDLALAFCVGAIQGALDGTGDDPVNGATHYYADNIAEPSWVSGLVNGKQMSPPATFCGKIGHHLFYKGVQ